MTPLTLAATSPARAVGILIRRVQAFGTTSAASSRPKPAVIGMSGLAAGESGWLSEQAVPPRFRSTNAVRTAEWRRARRDDSGARFIGSSAIGDGRARPFRSRWTGDSKRRLAALTPLMLGMAAHPDVNWFSPHAGRRGPERDCW